MSFSIIEGSVITKDAFVFVDLKTLLGVTSESSVEVDFVKAARLQTIMVSCDVNNVPFEVKLFNNSARLEEHLVYHAETTDKLIYIHDANVPIYTANSKLYLTIALKTPGAARTFKFSFSGENLQPTVK